MERLPEQSQKILEGMYSVQMGATAGEWASTAISATKAARKSFKIIMATIAENGPKAVKFIRRNLGVGGAEKVVDSANKVVTKLSPGKIRTYLSKIKDIPRGTLVKDMESIGLKMKGNDRNRPFLEFVDHKGRLRAKTHPPDKATKHHHLHIYTYDGKPMTKALEIITRKKGNRSPDAHIPIKEP